jgi:deoxyribose-phosphate aldolase
MKHLINYNKFINEDINNIQPIQSDINIQPQIQDSGNTQLPIYKNDKLIKFTNMIDYTCLRSDINKEMIIQYIKTAIENNFYSICIPMDFIDYTKYTIQDMESDLKVISVLDFPNGDSKERDNIMDTIKMISNGVDEIDMVIDYKYIKKAYLEEDENDKENMYNQVEEQIRKIANECHKNGVILKAIIEAGVLTYEEIAIACEISSNAGVDFIQTSTGTRENGNDINKIKEIRRLIPEYVKIKISGGIRTIQQCEEFYQYIDRIGTSVIIK